MSPPPETVNWRGVRGKGLLSWSRYNHKKRQSEVVGKPCLKKHGYQFGRALDRGLKLAMLVSAVFCNSSFDQAAILLSFSGSGKVGVVLSS